MALPGHTSGARPWESWRWRGGPAVTAPVVAATRHGLTVAEAGAFDWHASYPSPARFRGHPARHGEIWRLPLVPEATGRARAEVLVLATPSAVTQLVPGPHDTADADTALAFLQQLDVTWTPS